MKVKPAARQVPAGNLTPNLQTTLTPTSRGSHPSLGQIAAVLSIIASSILIASALFGLLLHSLLPVSDFTAVLI